MAPPPPRRHHHPIQPSFQDRAEVAAVSKQAIAVSHSAFSKAIAAQRGGGCSSAAAAAPVRSSSPSPFITRNCKRERFCVSSFSYTVVRRSFWRASLNTLGVEMGSSRKVSRFAPNLWKCRFCIFPYFCRYKLNGGLIFSSNSIIFLFCSKGVHFCSVLTFLFFFS